MTVWKRMERMHSLPEQQKQTLLGHLPRQRHHMQMLALRMPKKQVRAASCFCGPGSAGGNVEGPLTYYSSPFFMVSGRQRWGGLACWLQQR